MKKLMAALFLALPSLLVAQTAKIKIDVERTISEIDPKIYGVFMEPIQFNGRRLGLPDTTSFNTLYGNLYDPSSPLANEDGFRKDYIDAMKELKVSNMRWPGGNFLMFCVDTPVRRHMVGAYQPALLPTQLHSLTRRSVSVFV